MYSFWVYIHEEHSGEPYLSSVIFDCSLLVFSHTFDRITITFIEYSFYYLYIHYWRSIVLYLDIDLYSRTYICIQSSIIASSVDLENLIWITILHERLHNSKHWKCRKLLGIICMNGLDSCKKWRQIPLNVIRGMCATRDALSYECEKKQSILC